MKTFNLIRVGEGKVAEGVEFSTGGKVVIQWLAGVRSLETYDSLDDLRAIRELSGRTSILFISGDEHHSIEELYEYRMLYNAHAANEWARHGTYPVVKSWRHSDGELCFGGGWFVVVVDLPGGQASNHYRTKYWDLFKVPEVELAPEYDGHTPRDAADRLLNALAITPPDTRTKDQP